MVSVIVPVYNVEKYVLKCIDSIRRQTYTNLQIILIDDGSTDCSGEICDRVAKEDHRISVIHKPNGGLSDARNVGLSVSQGDFVCFIDSDDWIEPETIRHAVLEMEDSDVVIWGHSTDVVDENENVVYSSVHKTKGIINKDTGFEFFLRPGTMAQAGFAWNKLYCMQILKDNNFKFEKGLSLVEDMVFNFPLYLVCDRIKFIDYIGTHYIQRNRVTLSNAYYPNYLQLKLRVAKLMRTLLCGFGAPQDIAEKEYEQYLASNFRAVARSIAQMDESYLCKRRKMAGLLNDKTAKMIIENCAARKNIDRFFLFIARRKWVDVMLVIEGRKR